MAKRAILIAGPTASGKSALAIKMAANTNAHILNADSMQVYSGLNHLTARPSPNELTQANHHLYGYVRPEMRHSTGAYLADARALVADLAEDGRPLIFVGGTGLYFQGLIDGFISVPQISPEISKRNDETVRPLNRAQRGQLLAQKDPLMAQYLIEPDAQRVARALSVLEATGRSLRDWQTDEQSGLLEGYELEKIVISPERDVLRNRIEQRFSRMMDEGAVEEVKALLALEIDENLPVMKAIGVRQIGEMLAGKLSKKQAMQNSVTATHQYAKRQRTWFRNKMTDWDWRKS